jgi:hypothetical protein
MNGNVKWRRMMKISNHKDIEKIEQELRPWLKKRKIPLQTFDNLPPAEKFRLHGVAYTGTLSLSDAQLRTLYQNLVLGGRRTWKGRPIGPTVAESIEYEDLKEFFTPLVLSERLPELYKY